MEYILWLKAIMSIMLKRHFTVDVYQLMLTQHVVLLDKEREEDRIFILDA